MCLPINYLNYIVYLIKDASTPLLNQLLSEQTNKNTQMPIMPAFFFFMASRGNVNNLLCNSL